MRTSRTPRAVPFVVPLVVPCVGVVAVWVLVGAGVLVWLAARALGRLCREVGAVVGFVAGPVDALVTAWLGVAPVVPRWRRWRARWGRQVREEWRAYRAGAIEGDVMDGVWR